MDFDSIQRTKLGKVLTIFVLKITNTNKNIAEDMKLLVFEIYN